MRTSWATGTRASRMRSPASRREVPSTRKLVPELLELDGRFGLAPLGEKVDHLAERPNPRAREALRDLIEQTADHRFERGRRRQLAVRELGRAAR